MPRVHIDHGVHVNCGGTAEQQIVSCTAQVFGLGIGDHEIEISTKQEGSKGAPVFLGVRELAAIFPIAPLHL